MPRIAGQWLFLTGQWLFRRKITGRISSAEKSHNIAERLRTSGTIVHGMASRYKTRGHGRLLTITVSKEMTRFRCSGLRLRNAHGSSHDLALLRKSARPASWPAISACCQISVQSRQIGAYDLVDGNQLGDGRIAMFKQVGIGVLFRCRR